MRIVVIEKTLILLIIITVIAIWHRYTRRDKLEPWDQSIEITYVERSLSIDESGTPTHLPRRPIRTHRALNLPVERDNKGYQTLYTSAHQARDAVEESEQRFVETMDRLLDRLETAIDLIDAKDIFGERLTIAELRNIIGPMRAKAGEVIAAHENYGSAAEDFEEEMAKAIPLMLDVAQSFASYADQERFSDLQDSYLSVSESLVAVANKYKQRRDLIDPALQAVRDNIVYVEHSELFLVRLEEVLDVFPEDSPASEEFVKKIAEYVSAFERLRELLQEFHSATHEELPDERRTPPPEPTRRGNPVRPALTVSTTTDRPSIPPFVTFTGTTLLPGHREPVLPAEQLSGWWGVASGGVTLHLKHEGKEITFTLHRGSQPSHGHGRLRLIDDKTLVVEELIYKQKGGKSLRERGLRWDIVDSNTIQARSYKHTARLFQGARKTNQIVLYTLHRVVP